MFGWILKTDWDIEKLMEQYAKRFEKATLPVSPGA